MVLSISLPPQFIEIDTDLTHSEAVELSQFPVDKVKWQKRMTIMTKLRPTEAFRLWCESNLNHTFEFRETDGGFELVGHEDDIILVRMKF